MSRTTHILKKRPAPCSQPSFIKRRRISGIAEEILPKKRPDLPREIFSEIFKFLDVKEKTRLLGVSKWINHQVRRDTREISVEHDLDKYVVLFPNIRVLHLIDVPESYTPLKKLKHLEKLTWGGKKEDTFGSCPRDMLKLLPQISTLRHLFIHHKDGSCHTCAERYGWLTHLTTLAFDNASGLQNTIRKNICSLKNLKRLILRNVAFDTHFDPHVGWHSLAELSDTLEELVITKSSLLPEQLKYLQEMFGSKLTLINDVKDDKGRGEVEEQVAVQDPMDIVV